MRKSVIICIAIAVMTAGCGRDGAVTGAASTSVATTPTSTTTEGAGEGLETEVTTGISYSGSRKLDVYAPLDEGPWPVVVVVHGLSVRRPTTAAISEELASKGAVVFNTEVAYMRGDRLEFPTAIEQEACAVRFARSHAADYGGDPSRLVFVGHSAGALTGAVVALAGDEFSGECAVTEGSAMPTAFVGYEGPYNWSADRTHSVHEFEAEPGMWDTVDPYAHIGGNPDLAIRLVHGDLLENELYEIAMEHSNDFLRALQEAGYDAALVVVEGAGHMSVTQAGSIGIDAVVNEVLELIAG